jgi:hypothetical protein
LHEHTTTIVEHIAGKLDVTDTQRVVVVSIGGGWEI